MNKEINSISGIAVVDISTNDLIDIIERAEDSKLWARSIMAKRFASAISRDLKSGAIVKRSEYKVVSRGDGLKGGVIVKRREYLLKA